MRLFASFTGGAFYDLESTRIIYEKTDAQGFVGASAIEKIPVEKAVIETCRSFKSIPVPRKHQRKSKV
ncbi:MAG: phosphoenolpyruvate hydrolase family protein [Candidatus Freyarchaeota archaeon]